MIDALPHDWKRRRLRFDAKLNPLKSALDLADDTDVSFVPMDAVGEYGGLRLDQSRALESVYAGYTYFADGDTVVAKITPCFENGKGAQAAGLTNGVAFGTTELHVIRPKEALDARFLFFLTMAQDFRSMGEAEMLGAGGQKRVPEDFLKDWYPPLPPLDTQRRIARFLDDKTAQIDALVAKKRALLDRLAEKRQALITHAVTRGLDPDAPTKPSGIDWLGDIPAHWEAAELKRFATRIGSGVTPKGGASVYASSGTMLLRSQNVHFKGLSVADVAFIDEDTDNAMPAGSKVEQGDVLLNITGASIGRCCVFRHSDRSKVNQHVCIVRCTSDGHPDFISRVLESQVGQAQIDMAQNGASREGLNFEALGRFIMAMPPLQDQKAIAIYLDSVCDKTYQAEETINASIDRLTEYRAALVTAAVTGQLEDLT